MNNDLIQMPSEPTNLIFTGVAGTGKTHRLLTLQKLYDDSIEASWDEWRLQQISHYSWCEVVCAVLLLEDRLMTVPEVMRHPLIKDKSAANKRNENINQTIWVQLNTHAHPESKTVNSTQRSANYYFDKTESSQWYLLDEVKATLSQRLSDLLSLYATNSRQHYANTHVISRSCLVSFHQSYGYDEFVEGIRPHINQQTGQMQYEVKKGAFLELCTKAQNDPEHRYAILIDEINRANTAQVFGELMSVIEPSKRAGQSTPMSVRLAYSGRQFCVPSNVDIYATMNTQDHSLATLDTAFRRRFDFVTCSPDSSVVTEIIDAEGEIVDLARLMDVINHRLYYLGDPEAQLGQSYFMGINTVSQLAMRLCRKVIPQIIEYLKLSAMPNQIPHLLRQVLYGHTSIEEGSKIEHSLLKHGVSMAPNHSTTQPLGSELTLLEPNFIAASQLSNKIEIDNVEPLKALLKNEENVLKTDKNIDHSQKNANSTLSDVTEVEQVENSFQRIAPCVLPYLAAKTYQHLYTLDL